MCVQGATVPAQSDVSHATAPGDTSSFTTHNNSASISDDRPQSAGGKSESDGVSLKALALSIRAFNEIVTPLPTARRNQNGSFVAAGNTSRLASRKSLTRRPSTRCESVTNQQGPQGNIMRLIATAHDHEVRTCEFRIKLTCILAQLVINQRAPSTYLCTHAK